MMGNAQFGREYLKEIRKETVERLRKGPRFTRHSTTKSNGEIAFTESEKDFAVRKAVWKEHLANFIDLIDRRLKFGPRFLDEEIA